MSFEGTIRELGLHEVGQLLSLSRKTGTLTAWSLLRGVRGWIRFADGAMVDAGTGEPLPAGTATPAAIAGARSELEEVILDVLAWREGRFAFTADGAGQAWPGRVRIPTDLMLVESARRDDAWSRLRDRVSSAEVVPSFVDVEPKALPLLRLVPQEWEVLTRVDGQRTLRTLAQLLQRDLLEVAEVVHGLIGTGLLVVRDAGAMRRATSPTSHEAIFASTGALATDQPPAAAPAAQSPSNPAGPDSAEPDPDELWIPATAEMAIFTMDQDADDTVFDPLRAGLLTPHGSARAVPVAPSAPPVSPLAEPATEPATESVAKPVATVTTPAHGGVASEGAEPSSKESPIGTAASTPSPSARAAVILRDEADAAARRGDFETALTCWSRYLRSAEQVEDADRVREAIGLAARLQSLLYPEGG